jgi:Probable cobalt transporter subunit (CbtA)
MVKALVLRGAGVGAIAGLLAFIFARIFAEPVIQAAIDYESGRDADGVIVYPGFDADLLYRFRLYSVGAQIILWGVIGLGFAPLAEKVFQSYGQTSQKDMANHS